MYLPNDFPHSDHGKFQTYIRVERKGITNFPMHHLSNSKLEVY